MINRDRRRTFMALAFAIVGSSALFGAVFHGVFLKVFAIALVVQAAAALLGFGNHVFRRTYATMSHRDRATLNRTVFHMVAMLVTALWARIAYRDDFLEAWFLAYALIAVVGYLGATADLAKKFDEGYKAVVDDIESGRYPRV